MIASFRTNVFVVLALVVLAATFFVLGAGNYYGNGLTMEWGGYMGLVVASLAAYICLCRTLRGLLQARRCSRLARWPSTDLAATTTWME